MTGAAVGAALAAVGVAGAVLAVGSSPSLRRTTLESRLAPYLRDAPRPSRLLGGDEARLGPAALDRLAGRALRASAGWLDATLGGSVSVRRRLEAAGRGATVELFRLEQVVWAGAGLLAGAAVAVLAAARGAAAAPLAGVLLAGVLAVAGALLRDRLLSLEVERRSRRLLAELPTVADLLALSVAAGEGLVAAIDRVARIARGELSHELALVLAESRSGMPLVEALDRLARRSAVPAVVRFVEGMAVAVERGTPLAEVLRAQAVDAREQRRRALLESAGRREIAMLFPVVFLVLPVTVVFALFPGFANLSLVTP